jgi:hypothetical protein
VARWVLKNENCGTFTDYQIHLKARRNLLFLECQHLNLTSHYFFLFKCSANFAVFRNFGGVAVFLVHVSSYRCHPWCDAITGLLSPLLWSTLNVTVRKPETRKASPLLCFLRSFLRWGYRGTDRTYQIDSWNFSCAAEGEGKGKYDWAKPTICPCYRPVHYIT